MMRRILILIVAGTLLGFLAQPATSAGGGSVYEKVTYDDPYTYTDKECGFKVKVKGRAWGRSVTYNVPGSDGQAFRLDNRYHFVDVVTNPRNGKKMYISGHGHFRETTATHIDGDIWEFTQVDQGRPFTIKNGRHQTVLADHGKVIFKQTYDTLGDSKPGGEEVDFEVVRVARGSFPSLEPDFDFCRLAERLIG